MSKNNKIQKFAMKSVEEIVDYIQCIQCVNLNSDEQRDTLLLKIAFLLEDIRDTLRKKK